MTIGITACWVEYDGTLMAFNKKFSDQLGIIKEGVEEGLIEVGNHGLTHCVLKDNLFRPRLFSSNRVYHREFWDWIPESEHKDHIQRSQDILQGLFKKDIVTFIPPGNVWTEATERFASDCGLKYLSSDKCDLPTGQKRNGIKFLGKDNLIDFHDREIVLYGSEWLDRKTKEPNNYCSVKNFFS